MSNLSNFLNQDESGLDSFRNKIINGGFDVWQRGTSISMSLTDYGPDRWSRTYSTGGTRSPVLCTREDYDPADGIISPTPRYFCRLNFNVAQPSPDDLNQRFLQAIENIRQFENKDMTISFWCKASAALSLEYAGVRWKFINDTDIDDYDYNIPVTTTWSKIVVKIAARSLSNKTLSNDDNLRLTIKQPVSVPVNTKIDIANVQLEFGKQATEFERRPLQIEHDLCLRYYYSTLNVSPFNNIFTGEAMNSERINRTVEFPVPMRVDPTISIHSIDNETPGYVEQYNGPTEYGGSMYAVSPYRGGFPWISNGSGMTDGNFYAFKITADAEF